MSHTIKEVVKIGADILKNVGIESSILDSRVLLSEVLLITKEEIITKPDSLISSESFKQFMDNVNRRSGYEPIAYIIGKKEFYSIEFLVDKNVLIPRPDSEALIDTVFESYDQNSRIKILDLGTGSGCLLLTILNYLPNASGIAVDIEEGAIDICKSNYARLNLSNDIKFICSDWGGLSFKDEFDLIISNPPYINQADINILQPNVRDYEPLVALTGGEDGLAAYRAIAPVIRRSLKKSGVAVLECGVGQHLEIAQIMESHCLIVDKYIKDFGDRVRCLKMTKCR